MARPRKKQTAWQKRNAMARKRGYKSYYDYRIHDYGKIPPGADLTVVERAVAAGQRGPRGLRAALKNPDRVALVIEIPESDRTGQWSKMRYVITFTDGTIREYVVRTPKPGDLEKWRSTVGGTGANFIEYAMVTKGGRKTGVDRFMGAGTRRRQKARRKRAA